MSKQPPPAPTASAIGSCPTVTQIVGRPGTGSLPRTIAPPDHPLDGRTTEASHTISSPGAFGSGELKKIASLKKMCSTLKVPYSIIKCVLEIIYSNFFSRCKVEQKKTVAISQKFNHVQLHVHGMHLLNNRISV